MNKRVRVAVIGTSPYTQIMHLSALHSHPQAEIAAICGRNKARAQSLADRYAIRSVYTDYMDVFTDNSLDAVIIAVPDDLHYPLSRLALAAGLHQICEKPLTQTLEQAEELATQATQSGLVNMTYFSWRWLPHCEYLKQLISERFIGECQHAELNYHSCAALSEDYAWRWDSGRALGVLGDLGSHMIYLAQWYLGEVKQVTAALQTKVPKKNTAGKIIAAANDVAKVNLVFAGGVQADIHVSAVAKLGEREQSQQLTLYGDAGMLEAQFDLLNGYKIVARDNTATALKELPLPESILQGIAQSLPYRQQRSRIFTEKNVGTRAFIEAIVDGHQIQPDIQAGYHVQQVIDAACRSHRAGGETVLL